MIFPSKVDAFFYVVIVATIAIVVAAGLAVSKVKGTHGLIIMAPAVLLGIGLPVWLLFSTSYQVTADTLIVRAAWIRKEIPRSHIRAITPTRSPLSSPALSLDRLDIRYGNDEHVLVSPADKAGFAAALGFTL